MSPEEQKYYSRHTLLSGFGDAEQQRLKKANVLLIGAGGLGCPVGLYLAGAGVGRLTVLDYDVVDVSNLPRQILYQYSDIGKPKASIAAEQLRARNPFITVDSVLQKLTAANALDIISQYDLIIDGSDNFKTRYLVNDACVINNKPFVSGSVVGYEGQISVFNYKNGPTYRCLFPEPPLANESPSCSNAGVLNTLTGWVGTLMANEAIKVITGIGEPLAGKLSVLDGLNGSINEISFSRGNVFPEGIEEIEEPCSEQAYQIISENVLTQLITSGKKITLVDVREEWEIEEKRPGSIYIPLADIPHRYNELNQSVIAFTCSKGERSRLAAQWTVENLHLEEVYVLENQ